MEGSEGLPPTDLPTLEGKPGAQRTGVEKIQDQAICPKPYASAPDLQTLVPGEGSPRNSEAAPQLGISGQGLGKQPVI